MSSMDPFKAFIQKVKPLADSNRVQTPAPTIAPTIASNIASSKADPKKPVATGVPQKPQKGLRLSNPTSNTLTQSHLSFKRPHTLATDCTKLKKGKLAINARLDLHGLTVVQSRTKFETFLRQSHAQKFKCVQIVHGKGLNSNSEPILKAHTAHWLEQVDFVLAYASCLPKDGGTGAVYVLLKG